MKAGKETPRQAVVRRLAERFARRHFVAGGKYDGADTTEILRAFGPLVWDAARRLTIREMAKGRRLKPQDLRAIRKAGH